MDRIFEDLSKSLAEEDEAKRKLHDAQSKTRMTIMGNLPKLVDMGIVKISVDRRSLDRVMGHPRKDIGVPARF